MDSLFSGRFLTALAKRLSEDENKDLLHIFEEVIVQLHSQAERLRISLKNFYKGAVKAGKGSSLRAPVGEVAFESESSNKEAFKAYLSQRSEEWHTVQIARSVLKFPPSNTKVALRLNRLLSKTKDLSIFEAKLIQIYLQER